MGKKSKVDEGPGEHGEQDNIIEKDEFLGMRG